MKYDVVTDTVNKGMCIGCGICKNACPHDAIPKISYNKNKEYIPTVDQDKCTDCNLCRVVCSKSEINIGKQVREVAIKRTYYGLDNIINIEKGFTINYNNYIKSASGGVVSALLSYLMEHKIIDAVIHAEALYGDKENKYFKSSLSRSIKEINTKQSSFYHPIEFSTIIENIKKDNSIENVVILGTPCVIESIHYLQKIDPIINKKIKFKFALMCSHQVNGFFTDSLIKEISKGKKTSYKVNYRNKEGIQNHQNYNNSLISKDNIKILQSRFKGTYTEKWRSFSYSLRGCMVCVDFFGKYADMGFKDAWGFQNVRKEGETVFTINNKQLNEIIQKMKTEKIIFSHPVLKEELIKSQGTTVQNKTLEIDLKIKKTQKKLYKKYKNLLNVKSYTPFENICKQIDFYSKNFNRNISNFLIRKFDITNLPHLKIFMFYQKCQNIFIKFANKKREHILEQKKKLHILYTAGFGYGNMGDEAQLGANLDIWKNYTNNITILSPNIPYTEKTHPGYNVIHATRKTFWGFQFADYAGIGNSKLFLPFFIYNYIILVINAYLLQYTGYCFLRESAFGLLSQIKNTSILHIGGGGYITGKTVSRFYDYLGLIKIAKIFKTKILLTGHTIGITQNFLQKSFLKSALKNVLYIGIRDHDESLKQVIKHGIKSENIYPSFDDALFCNGIDGNSLKMKLIQQGIDKKKKYIVVQTHYWKNNISNVKKYLKNLAYILDVIKKRTGYNIICVQMDKKDKDSENQLIYNMKEKAYIYENNGSYKEVISLIQNAELCITMKHHPIIFAMAGSIPTLSVYFDTYYKHKNLGAMKLFNQEKYLLGYDVFDKHKKIIAIINNLLENKNQHKKIIEVNIEKMKKENGKLIKKFLTDNNYILK